MKTGLMVWYLEAAWPAGEWVAELEVPMEVLLLVAVTECYDGHPRSTTIAGLVALGSGCLIQWALSTAYPEVQGCR